jgi:hypothetical protein
MIFNSFLRWSERRITLFFLGIGPSLLRRIYWSNH